MDNDILKVLYSQEQISEACHRLGKQIQQEYQGKFPVVIGVLKGATFFMTDIVRALIHTCKLILSMYPVIMAERNHLGMSS